jgi:lipopolysaccharide/colanic/teichoic acid biosynthesis glycosyltransferase
MGRESVLETGANRYRFRRFRGQPLVSIIYSPREFRGIIHRECARSVRYNSRFSLAVFEVGTRDENSVLIRHFVRTMHRRFRDTDEIGWYRRGQLGVMMPFTPSEGARQLAEHVSEIISSLAVPPPFTIYSYPSDNWPKRHRLEKYLTHLNVFAAIGRLYVVSTPKSNEFHSLMARERGRADRNGNIFSLIIFRMANLPPGISVQRRLLVSLGSRLRDIDEYGWYDDRHLGAIIPYASGKNAQRIAESICRDLSLPATNETFIVYTYPESWFSDQLSDLSLNPVPVVQPESLVSTTPAGSPVGCPSNGVGVKTEEMGHNAFLYRPLPIWKRTLDLAVSLTTLILLSPLFLFAMVLIKLVSPGPVLFKQERIGYMRRAFTLFKFRTMEVGTDTYAHAQHMRKLIVKDSESRPLSKLESSPHIIRYGRLLRASCIDELPQFFNVLRGEMSLVGPRPCLAYEADEYQRWHVRRFDSVPGMTGLWQVMGKNRTTFKEMIRFDISYTQNLSLWLDLKILFLTPVAIVRQIIDKPGPEEIGADQPATS